MIYFIQAGKNGPIKIGYTDNEIENRVKQLQTGCPYELRVLWVYRGDDYTESEIHGMLSNERVRGEWFHPSKDLFELMNDLENENEIKTFCHSGPIFVSELPSGKVTILSPMCQIDLYPSKKHMNGRVGSDIVVFRSKKTDMVHVSTKGHVVESV